MDDKIMVIEYWHKGNDNEKWVRLSDYVKLLERNKELERAIKDALDYLWQEHSLRWVNEIVDKYNIEWGPYWPDK